VSLLIGKYLQSQRAFPTSDSRAALVKLFTDYLQEVLLVGSSMTVDFDADTGEFTFDVATDASTLVFEYDISGDETTVLTTGTAKRTWRMPIPFLLQDVRSSLTTASSSGNPTVDVNVGGTSVFGANKLSIDANEKTSTTATTAATFSELAIGDDAELTFDVDTAGTNAAGLKVYLIGQYLVAPVSYVTEAGEFYLTDGGDSYIVDL
jgi:hypothetical protein